MPCIFLLLLPFFHAFWLKTSYFSRLDFGARDQIQGVQKSKQVIYFLSLRPDIFIYWIYFLKMSLDTNKKLD